MQRPLKDGDVPQLARQTHLGFGTAAALGQQDDRQVRPGRLVVKPVLEQREAVIAERFLGEDRGACAHLFQRAQDRRNIAFDASVHAGAHQNVMNDL